MKRKYEKRKRTIKCDFCEMVPCAATNVKEHVKKIKMYNFVITAQNACIIQKKSLLYWTTFERSIKQ